MTDNRMDAAEYNRVFGPLRTKYFTDEDEARWRQAAAEEGDAGGEVWEALIGEGKAMLAEGLDPDAPEAMALAVRWMGLMQRYSGGDPLIHAKVEAMWKEAFRDPQFRERSPFSPELMDWVGAAIRAAYAAGKMAYPAAEAAR